MDKSIEELVVEKLINLGYHISFAESCTGGLLSARLVNVANASKVLDVSFVTYHEDMKAKYLGVKKETILKYDVVSEEVASEMALGVCKEANSNIGVSVTGYSGPTGGTDSIPVGTVCFGFCINGKVYTEKKMFGNVGRNKVRSLASDFAFLKLNELL